MKKVNVFGFVCGFPSYEMIHEGASTRQGQENHIIGKGQENRIIGKVGSRKSHNRLMARILDKIKTIDGSKETLKLAVRITDLWFVGTPDKSELAEMVIIDFDGDEIHVVCKQDQVSKNDGQYRVCDHAYKLTFIGVTVVRQCELDGLPFKKYRFVEFCDVIVGQLQPGLLVDIIGVVDEVVFRHVSLRSKKVVFKLMELSNQLLSCTLRDDYCLQFLEYLDEHESESPIIVLLTNAKIKEGQGSYPSSVSNSLKASKLAINQQVAPIQEFNQSMYRLLELGIEVRPVLTRRSAKLSSKETFISKSEAKTISEINNIFEVIMLFMFNCLLLPWLPPTEFYACVIFHRNLFVLLLGQSRVFLHSVPQKIDEYTEPFACACGKYNDRVVLRSFYPFSNFCTTIFIFDFNTIIYVCKHNENTRFLLWDRECTELIGQSADEVNSLKIAVVQPKYKNSAVLKCSSDLTLISDVLNMLPNAKTCSKIKVIMLGSNDPAQHASQSMSMTADHDPLIGLSLTSTKRHPSDECDDEARSSQISLAQLSSNKLGKHEQIE
ncbi:hypothetical protein HKD37_07G020049 [Glycine soja]